MAASHLISALQRGSNASTIENSKNYVVAIGKQQPEQPTGEIDLATATKWQRIQMCVDACYL